MAAYVSETVFETDMMGSRTENAHQNTVIFKYKDVLQIFTKSGKVYNPASRCVLSAACHIHGSTNQPLLCSL